MIQQQETKGGFQLLYPICQMYTRHAKCARAHTMGSILTYAQKEELLKAECRGNAYRLT